MSDLTEEQLKNEFIRQAKLCSGLGKIEMLKIVNATKFIFEQVPPPTAEEEISELANQIDEHITSAQVNKNKASFTGENKNEKDWAFFSGEESAFRVCLTYVKDLLK